MVLGREEIERRLAQNCLSAGGEHWSSQSGTLAAVLLCLIGYAGGPSIILTRRQAHLKNHAAEISLPGGRAEVTDDDPASTALRETLEEIGLASDRIELLGCLPPRVTISGFRVYPLVGWIEPPVDLVMDSREVAEVFEVPLSFVLDRKNHARGSTASGGKSYGFYVLEYQDHCIWGATAQILVDLAGALS